jgi:hypothetical protein
MSTAILDSVASAPVEVWRDDAREQRKTEERRLSPEDIPEALSIEQEFEIEIDYAVTSFPVEGDISVHVADPNKGPIRLGYSDKEETLEVIGWGISVPLEKAEELQRLIGRRFLELYSKAVTGSLKEEDRQWLRTVSEQMDYHSFAASRKLPRYREATLVRKSPVLLVQFLEDRNIKLDGSLTAKLTAIDEGDRFSAWFTSDGTGKIVDFQHVLRLPTLDEDLAEMASSSSVVEIPPSVRSLFPKIEPES